VVIVGGRIWTGETADAPNSAPGMQATAVAIRDGKVLDYGDDATMQRYVGTETELIDAGGRRIIPGITDSHTHIVGGGIQLARLALRGAQDKEQFIGMVAAEAMKLGKDEWVLGGRWSVESWATPENPTKEWLDPITRGRPALLSRMDGHQALVNSAALALAGIDRNGPPDPKGGEIERDPSTGEPTGILKESAQGLVRRHVPSISAQKRYEAFRRAMVHAGSLGVTSVQDMCEPEDLAVFRRAESEGVMTVRLTGYLSVGDWSDDYDTLEAANLNSDTVRLAGFKGYMDGSMGSRTAYMHDHYSDATPEMLYPRGQLTALAEPHESFRELVADADARGYQLAAHAIGDEANHLLLDAYAYARKRNGKRQHLHRDEHTQHLQVSDIPRFAELGVVASMQPFHKADDGRYAEKVLGKERMNGSYAYRQLVDAGALVVFGSDWPVVTLNPFAGVAAAVNAKTIAGDVWLESHSLTVGEALYAYTHAPAKAIGMEAKLGSIAPGKYADLLILDQDPFTIDPDRLGDVRPVLTMVGGVVVFERK
jgi:predicted amidohydrolase YtcJ